MILLIFFLLFYSILFETSAGVGVCWDEGGVGVGVGRDCLNGVALAVLELNL